MTDRRVDANRLSRAAEPPPAVVHNDTRPVPWVFLCEHAGNRIPASLKMLADVCRDLERFYEDRIVIRWKSDHARCAPGWQDSTEDLIHEISGT